MNPTKKRMLDAGRDFLLTKGVEATAVEDILKATKTGKSQFYHFFGSKAGMVRAVLNTLVIRQMEQTSAITGWENAKAFLQQLEQNATLTGHPIALLAMSIRPEERNQYPELLTLYHAIRAPLLGFLQTEQEAGRFLASVEASEMADLALTNIIGASILTAINPPVAPATDRAAHHMYLYLKAYARA